MSGAVDDEFGMLAAKCFGDVAAPTDGPVGGHGLLEIFDRDFVPLNGFAVRINESGRMIVPLDFAKRLVAIDAGLACIPLIDDGGNKAGPGRFLDLRQTLLAAGFFFRPAGAFAEADVRGTDSRLCSGLRCGNADARGLMRFRARDNSLPAEFQIGAQRASQFENGSREDGNQQEKKDVFHRSFPS